MLARSFCLSLIVIAFAGCKPATELGNSCDMVKRDPNIDGGRLFIQNQEIKVGANKDFISFGTTDCEDLVCVRDSQFPVAVGAAPTDTAKGYCSKQCIPGDVCPSATPGDTSITCRALLLDAETLRVLCNGSDEDRAKCKSYFGNTESPYFCARGGTDAGI